MERHCIVARLGGATLSKQLSITMASRADVPDLARLFDAYRCFYEQPTDLAGAEAYVAGEVEGGRTQFFIARLSDGAAAGFLHLIPGSNTLAMRPMWFVEDLFVDPAARRKGVAKALMQQAERFARETGAERLTLATANDNYAAQALYKELGYAREGRFWYFHLPLR